MSSFPHLFQKSNASQDLGWIVDLSLIFYTQTTRLREVINFNKNRNHLSIAVKGLVSRECRILERQYKFLHVRLWYSNFEELVVVLNNCNRFAVHVHLYPTSGF